MIPIFIISFNRLTCLKRLIERLQDLGQTNLVVIDNASTYPPLLDYYQEIDQRIQVIRMGLNCGHNVLRMLCGNPQFLERYRLDQTDYAYTDSDILPVEECPRDFIDKFRSILIRYPQVSKVGFSLKIDDLPDTFAARAELVFWEMQFWKEKIRDLEFDVDLYPSPIDTTFAVRRAHTLPGWSGGCFRVGEPYTARHLPWYIDDDDLSDEDKFYRETALPKETHFPGRYKMIEGVLSPVREEKMVV